MLEDSESLQAFIPLIESEASSFFEERQEMMIDHVMKDEMSYSIARGR